MIEFEHKHKTCRKITVEDFTPTSSVDEILDKLPPDVWSPKKSFLDNFASNDNFLICVLIRKLLHGHNPLQTLSTIYGVELIADNVKEIKQKLLDALSELDNIKKLKQ